MQLLVAGRKIDGSNLSCVEGQGGPLRHGKRLSALLVRPQRDCGENQPGSDLQCPYPQLWGPLASHVRAESRSLPRKVAESHPLPARRGLSSSGSSRVSQPICATVAKDHSLSGLETNPDFLRFWSLGSLRSGCWESQVSGEDPLPSSRMAVFSLGPQLAEGARELPGVFFFFFK